MSKTDLIEMEGEVTEVLRNAMFRVKLQNGFIVTAYLSGKLRRNHISVYEGDNVTLELSPYDLTKGRIIWRNIPNNPRTHDTNKPKR